MSSGPEGIAVLRDQVANMIFGTVFVFLGFAACAIAAIRRRSGVRILIWLGIWSAMYGFRQLFLVPDAIAALPERLRLVIPAADAVMSYLLVVFATLAFLELSRGRMRSFLKVVVAVGLAIALAGISWFVVTGDADAWMFPNNLLATCSLLNLVTVVAIPSLSRKSLILYGHRVLIVGTLFFAAEALYVNLAGPLHYQTIHVLDSVGFAALLFSFGYVAVELIFTNERRLLSIENELEIARQLQFSILPASIPSVTNLRIAATYQPMTAVAGDFYEFLPVDQHRAGFLVADVSGHGVPAALIASMIKVAAQTVTACAHDPAEVLRQLSGVLSGQLRGQFVSAAYLWIDTEARQARYSAAGHPPLLCWRAHDGALLRIESNGLLFGVMPDSDYPVCDVPLASGDRFLLYTDGVVEPENEQGDQFGDHQLEQVVRRHHSCTASELSERLLSAVRNWQPASVTQQDDITLIVIDVL